MKLERLSCKCVDVSINEEFKTLDLKFSTQIENAFSAENWLKTAKDGGFRVYHIFLRNIFADVLDDENKQESRLKKIKSEIVGNTANIYVLTATVLELSDGKCSSIESNGETFTSLTHSDLNESSESEMFSVLQARFVERLSNGTYIIKSGVDETKASVKNVDNSQTKDDDENF